MPCACNASRYGAPSAVAGVSIPPETSGISFGDVAKTTAASASIIEVTRYPGSPCAVTEEVYSAPVEIGRASWRERGAIAVGARAETRHRAGRAGRRRVARSTEPTGG